MRKRLIYAKTPGSSYKEVGSKRQKTSLLAQKGPHKSKVIHIRCSLEDWLTLTDAAKSCGNTLSAWLLFTVMKSLKGSS